MKNEKNPIHLSWRRPVEGYEWIVASKISARDFAPDDLLLVEKKNFFQRSSFSSAVPPASNSIRGPYWDALLKQGRIEYVPPPDLFAKFARLSSATEEILNFANEYGCIRERYIVFDHPSPNSVTLGVSLNDWVKASWDFGLPFLLWSALSQADRGNQEPLRQLVCWDLRETRPASAKGIGSADFVLPPEIRIHGRGGIDQTEYHGFSESEVASFSSGDIFRPARLMLSKLVESTIDLVLTLGSDGTLARAFTPKDLLSLFWWQLADAATHATELRFCQNRKCGKIIWIDPRGEGKRSNREYCSGDACRLAVYASRKLRAYELWKEERLSPVEIANRLSDDPGRRPEVEVVQRWIVRALSESEKLSVKEIARSLRLKQGEVRELIAVEPRSARHPPPPPRR